MALHDRVMKVISAKAVEAVERLGVDIIVRKLRTQGVTVSKSTRALVATALHEGRSSIDLPDSAVPAGKRPKVSITKTDLREVDRRIKIFLDRSLPDIIETGTTKSAPRVLKNLVSRWPDRANWEQQIVEGFRQRQWKRWRKGLSGLAMMLTITRRCAMAEAV